MAKRILHKFKMDEISGVDRMAQEGAKAVIMKRDDSIAKGAFIDAVTVMEARETVQELWWDLWESDDAMQEAIYMIINNPERYPDVQTSIVEALGEYSAKVQEQAAEAAAAVPSMDGGNEPPSNDPTMKSDQPDGDNENPLIPKEETKMSKNTEPTVETLTEELTAVNDKLAKAEAFGKLTDAEKAHFETLNESDQEGFLKMDEGARANVIEKTKAEDPVVYTSHEGEEFHKSDDPRLVRMAKQADEDRKARLEEMAKRETMEFTKRADDELSHLPGETNAKVALLKAIAGIEDEGHVKTINELLKAADDNLAKSFETQGTTTPAIGSAEEQLDNLAKSYAETKEVSIAKAYDEVLKTDKGAALYRQTQS